ncbi:MULTISPECIES: DeoR/GlpR family DNA-binding transcription regulator [unclassified Mesorhizobium]|uniref:DeoR/GlpR family DNA-binding transcription regulator n=1 Tax=unclassified Mesorhizobium TaxID=325217 RepID=UPI00112B7B4A|nr:MULTISPECIES: DeoR/GlpR family DNA-binding transcription regulator [unclassified Mesorhizobium]TPL02151.1 DeoR/GlpR transcriptional regulator [Mesorhizobium sp. B2-4-16]TPL57391.1 DeoR/GlpR transcriptional regulator [Mesorhizobium sp. B2-4-3]
MLNTAEDRQAKIVELLRDELFLDIRGLTQRFQVSVATMRRDLGELEEAGLLRRTHGGAVSINQVSNDPSNADRAISHLTEKRTIAAAAAVMISEGDTVLLDAGTTALEVAKLLRTRAGLTFITNGSDIIAELLRGEAPSVYAVGGEYAEINRSFRGPLAEHFIRQFNVDKLILNAASIDLDRGLIFTGSPVNASIQQAMIEVSRRVIVVADYSKFTKPSFSVVTKIEDVGAIVTDAGGRSIIATAPEKLRRKFVIAN